MKTKLATLLTQIEWRSGFQPDWADKLPACCETIVDLQQAGSLSAMTGRMPIFL
jgi:hypothetical protein